MSSSSPVACIRSSRLVRVLAMFAWVMLVGVSLPATAMASSDHAPATMSSMAGHGMTHHSVSGAHRQDDCCGNPAHPACHCDAACGSLLLPALPAWPGGTALAVNYAPFHGRMAPTPPLLPPLRPPAA